MISLFPCGKVREYVNKPGINPANHIEIIIEFYQFEWRGDIERWREDREKGQEEGTGEREGIWGE